MSDEMLNILIGEAGFWFENVEPRGRSMYVDVDVISNDMAPTYFQGEAASRTNQIVVSEQEWQEFLRHVGLFNEFYHTVNSELQQRGGSNNNFVIDAELAEKIDEAAERFEPELVEAINEEPSEKTITTAQRDYMLVWMQFWVHYALENFPCPIFYID